jgi:hypothetical protein
VAVPEPNDVKVLIPRVRRAIDGPAATSAQAPSNTYSDDELKGLIADAIGEIIFFTGGLFPHTLDVTARDDTYGAPDEWAVNPPLSEAEASVVAAQAALNTYFFGLQKLKTQETISDEGQTWSYSISATVVRDQMQYLIALRDKALEQITAEQSAALDSYVSFVHERDILASAYVEPWVEGGGYGGLELEAR